MCRRVQGLGYWMNKIKTHLDEDRDRNVIKLTILRKTKTSLSLKKTIQVAYQGSRCTPHCSHNFRTTSILFFYVSFGDNSDKIISIGCSIFDILIPF